MSSKVAVGKLTCTRRCQLRNCDRPDIPCSQLRHPNRTALPTQDIQAAKLYSQLKERQTRLLVLHPGRLNEPLVADLEVVDLADTSGAVLHDSHRNVQYEALSYCWGPPIFGRPIIMNGILYSITDNLFDALQRLRHMSTVRHLWVDAICINQHNVAERSMQVLNMLTIYKRSKSVLVWLGELGEHADFCLAHLYHGREANMNAARPATAEDKISTLEWLETGFESDEELELTTDMIDSGGMETRLDAHQLTPFSEQMSSLGYKPVGYEPEYVSSELQDLASACCEPHMSRLAQGLRQLLEAPWFQRVWIRQEVWAAQQVFAFVGCRRMDWRDLTRALSRISTNPPVDAGAELARCADVYKRRVAGLGRALSVELLGAENPGLTESTKNRAPETNFTTLLLGASLCDSTDPRDYVYGVLGMATLPMVVRGNTESRARLMAVDYTKTASEVFQDTARYLMAIGDPTSVLSLSADFGTQVKGEDLPSWCPNWSRRTERRGYYMEPYKLAATFPQRSMLRLDGYCLGTVALVAQLPLESASKRPTAPVVEISPNRDLLPDLDPESRHLNNMRGGVLDGDLIVSDLSDYGSLIVIRPSTMGAEYVFVGLATCCLLREERSYFERVLQDSRRKDQLRTFDII